MGPAAKRWRAAAEDPSKLWLRIERLKSIAKTLRSRLAHNRKIKAELAARDSVVMDEKLGSETIIENQKRDLIVTESPDGMWRVWEQKTPGDYTLVAGPFNSAELAHAAAGEIRAEEDTSNDAEDASGIDCAIRARLLQPFLGSEAEKLGAKEYKLRKGEKWVFECGNSWEEILGYPFWFNDDTYRLATGE